MLFPFDSFIAKTKEDTFTGLFEEKTSQMKVNSVDATVVITTRNRKEDLRKAVRSCLDQVGVRLEVLVIDDGSTDGTSEMIRVEFPQVRLHRSEVSQGLIAQRNRGAKLASAPIIFSIDDDCAFSGTDIVVQTLSAFDHPRIGAVTIPLINVRMGQNVLQSSPESEGIFVTNSFIGCAHALRKDIFLQLNGYREQLFHQGEEGDYCLRMLQAGYFVRLGRTKPIHHCHSANRSHRRIVVFDARNYMLFVWHNVPLPHLPLFSILTLLRVLNNARRKKCIAWALEGLVKGCTAIAGQEFRNRQPVSSRVFRLYRRLSRRAMRIEQVEGILGD